MPLAKVRFTVAVADADRNLFSIVQRKNGDLTIGFGFAEKFEFVPQNPKITHQKYSVHRSPNSVEFNTITHEIVLSDGSKFRSTALTDAIKGKTGFQPLFVRRCPDLSIDRYLLPVDDKAVRAQLTSSDMPLTLVYGVYVGEAGAAFGPQPNVSVYEWDFEHFKIVVLSQHLALPPHRTGMLFHHVTVDPRNADSSVHDHLRKMMRGQSAALCTTHFTRASLLLAIQMTDQVKQEITDHNLLAYLDAIANTAHAKLAELDAAIWLIAGSDDFRIEPDPLDFSPSVVPPEVVSDNDLVGVTGAAANTVRQQPNL